jgi:hypothetical protein
MCEAVYVLYNLLMEINILQKSNIIQLEPKLFKLFYTSI